MPLGNRGGGGPTLDSEWGYRREKRMDMTAKPKRLIPSGTQIINDFNNMMFGSENVRNQNSFPGLNNKTGCEPVKEVGVWFTKLPRSYTIPSEDLLNVFGLPRDFRDKYTIDPNLVLGEGAYGTVFEAVETASKRKVAVKVLYKRIHKKKQRAADVRYLCRLKNELEMLRSMGRGTYAVHFQDAFEDDDNIYLVMEKCDGPTLKHYIRQRGIGQKKACKILSQIIQMLAVWHKQGYMHCDMKPANLLMRNPNKSDDVHIKVTDFGLATEFSPGTKQHKKQGTKVYMAPEMLLKKYDEKADMWSVGVIAYQLLTGRLPFCRQDSEMRKLKSEDLEKRILSCHIDTESSPTWDEISADAKDFICRILERDPANRLSSEEALLHPWIISANEPDVDLNDIKFKRARYSSSSDPNEGNAVVARTKSTSTPG